MELIIGVIVVTMLMSKAVSNAKLDHTYAKQGNVSPRLEAKYGSNAAARAKVAKYGFTDHLRDAWRDSWARRTEAMVAARDARAAGGGRPRLRDRVKAAKKTTGTTTPTATTVVAPPATAPKPTTVFPPVTQTIADPDITNPPPAAPPAAPAPVPTTPPPLPAADDQPATGPAPTRPAVPAQPDGGTTVTAPTGEVVNYETALAEIDAAIADVTTRIDADQAALASIAETKAAIDVVQTNYQATATAAQTKLDHEAALNLDGTTLGHAGDTVDAMPPNAVEGLYDQAEAMELLIQARLDADEVALASLEAERAHLIATYGDAHATVAGNLGGDSRFVSSDGGGGSAVGGGATYVGEPTNEPAAGTPAPVGASQ